jgi:bacillithiol system protein YtxJ
MHWNPLTDLHQLDEIVEISQNQPVVIFKHSTRCSISSTALSRFERAWGDTENAAFYLDLIAYRPISLEIAEKFEIQHQSPQALVINKGACTYSATHWDISVDELKPYLSE